MQKTGSINETGYLRGMDRRGYSAPKCVLELVANSADSLDDVTREANFTPTIAFDVKRESITMMDNGQGMTLANLQDMFDLHRENHSDKPRRGVSGIGAKPSLSILSGKAPVHIFTHTRDGPYLHAMAPWDVIHAKGVYTGMIETGLMTEDEQAEYIREREQNGMLNGGRAHGTSIRVPYRDDLNHLLEANFNPIAHENAIKNPLDRIGVVFGHDDIELFFKSYEHPNRMLMLHQYNYFNAEQAEFYTGKSQHTIRHIRCDKDDHDRFILLTENGQMEIRKDGRGLAKTPEKISTGTLGYRTVGEFNVLCGLRLDKDVFDPDAPVELGAGKNTGVLNVMHLGDNELFLGSIKLVRNNQLIGLIPQPDISITSARGNGSSYLEYILVQAELQFNPVSKQDNRQDIVTGIQENKNQFDGANVPKQLTRLIAYVKKLKAKEIQEYFAECLNAVGQPQDDQSEPQDSVTPLQGDQHENHDTAATPQAVDNGRTVEEELLEERERQERQEQLERQQAERQQAERQQQEQQEEQQEQQEQAERQTSTVPGRILLQLLAQEITNQHYSISDAREVLEYVLTTAFQ